MREKKIERLGEGGRERKSLRGRERDKEIEREVKGKEEVLAGDRLNRKSERERRGCR